MDWGIALKIWAVVGPLIAGGASAIWSRRNQLQDREHDSEQQRIAREQSLQDRNSEYRRSTIGSRKVELRTAIAQFVAAANDYISLCQTNSTPSRSGDTKRLELEASARLNANYQTVSILGTDEISKLAKVVLNSAVDFPSKALSLSGDEQEKYRDTYLLAKRDLSSAARKLFGIESEI